MLINLADLTKRPPPQETVTSRIPVPLWEQLCQLATHRETTISALVREALVDFVNRAHLT